MGKHKRQNKHADKHAQRQFERDSSQVDSQGQSQNDAPCHTREHQGKDKLEPPMKLRESAERSSLTDWLVAAFTCVLAAVGIYQFIILDSQLGVMRKDQRPWLKLELTLNNLTVGQPITATMKVVNNGKTPARAISGDMVIERVKDGEQAQINYPLPHARFSTGLLFPNDPFVTPIKMVRKSSTGATEDDLLMQSELEDFQKFRIFFVAYATINYEDFLGVDHWTKVCAVEVPANTPGDFTGKNCTDYGDVDSN